MQKLIIDLHFNRAEVNLCKTINNTVKKNDNHHNKRITVNKNKNAIARDTISR